MIMKNPPIVSLPIASQCDLCDSSYVGYTLRHLHQRVVEHKNMSSSISKHYKDKHSTVKKILKKCNNKFDCLVHEMLLISKQNFLRDFAYFIGCAATEGSEQQHNQDLKEIYKGRRILEFITFYHNALHLTTFFTTMHCI